MKPVIRILLCDDSSVMRRLIKTALKTDSSLHVVAEAAHGRDVVQQLPTVKPDVIIMDVEMPVMDGIDAVRTIRRQSNQTPIIMFSSLTSRGAEATLDAIEAGANDFATKPVSAGHINEAIQHVQRDLIPRVLQWGRKQANPPTAAGFALRSSVTPRQGNSTSQSGAINRIKPNFPQTNVRQQTTAGSNRSSTQSPSARPPSTKPATDLNKMADRSTGGSIAGTAAAVAIAVSTGGPQALTQIIADLPTNLNTAILIAQHMPPVFTGLLAERLAAQKGHRVTEAKDGDPIEAGQILIAPGDYHMTVGRDSTLVRAYLNQDPPENSCRPAADPLFRSVAKTYGRNCLGIVLTGMGTDGAKGAESLRLTGARVIAQDQISSVVWGMPGHVVNCGQADKVLPLDQIASEVIRVAGTSPISHPSS